MSRRAGRLAAVEVLYAADVRREPIAQVFAERAEADPGVSEYAEHLARGVDERLAEIDEILGRAAPAWAVERMSVVDRNVLRVAVLELLQEAAPPAVVMDEAVELAKRFSGDEAGRFVNGVLTGVLRLLTEPRTPPEPSGGGSAPTPGQDGSSFPPD